MPASRYPAVLAAALMVLSTAPVVFAQPAVTSAVPGAVRPGAEIDIDLHGANLTGDVRIWTSFPGTAQLLEQDAEGKRVKCRFKVPADADVGIGGIVLGTPAGLTDIYWLPVDDLAGAADPGTNHDAATAMELAVPHAVDGVADGPVSDFYRIQLSAGQRVACEVIAARMGSTCDPVLRVLDPAGSEVAMADDEDAVGADCRLEFTAAQDGAYLIEVRDSKYAAGGRYRLRVGDFPAGAVAYPLAVRAHSATMLDVLTPAGKVHSQFTSLLPPPYSPMNRVVAARIPGGTTAAATRVALSDAPQYCEVEPNNEAAAATKILVPGGANGVLETGEDRDYFEFYAAAGDRLEFRARARSLGSPAFPMLRLYDANGTQVAESPVTELDELQMAYAIPADGLYRLSVEALLRQGSANSAYYIDIDRVPFVLNIKNAKDVPYKQSVTADNGAFALDLQIQRNGYDGPITLRLDPPSERFELITPQIAAQAAEARVVIAPREGVGAGEIDHVRLVGSVDINGRRYDSAISTLANLRAKWPTLIHPPAWSDGLLSLSVVPTAPAFFETDTEQREVFAPRGVNTATFTLKTTRSDAEYKEVPLVVLHDLPAGVTYEQKTENDQHQFTLTGTGALRRGSYPITAVAFGLHKGRGVVRRVPLLLNVQEPLAIEVVPAGPLTVGQSQKLKITAVRRGSDRQPVSLEFTGLPAGVTIAAATLPADQDTIEVDVTAAADAAAGPHTVGVTASTQYAQQPVAQQATFTLEVRAAQ